MPTLKKLFTTNMKVTITRAQLEKALGGHDLSFSTESRMDFEGGTISGLQILPFPETIEVEVEESILFCRGCGGGVDPSLPRQVAYPDPSNPPTPTEPVGEGEGSNCPYRNPDCPKCFPYPVPPEVPKPPKIDDSWCGNERLQELIRRENKRNGYDD